MIVEFNPKKILPMIRNGRVLYCAIIWFIITWRWCYTFIPLCTNKSALFTSISSWSYLCHPTRKSSRAMRNDEKKKNNTFGAHNRSGLIISQPGLNVFSVKASCTHFFFTLAFPHTHTCVCVFHRVLCTISALLLHTSFEPFCIDCKYLCGFSSSNLFSQVHVDCNNFFSFGFDCTIGRVITHYHYMIFFLI